MKVIIKLGMLDTIGQAWIRQDHAWLHSQSQAWKMMLSQHAVHQPITGLGDDIIPECNATNTPL